MKEWIKNITYEEIASIYKKKHLREKPSEATNKRILSMIDGYSLHKKKTSTFKRFLLVAAIISVFIVPALFFLNNLQNSSQLFLAKTVNHITFSQQDKTLQLNQGNRISKDTLIQTGIDSACTIQYAEKATLQIYEESEIAVTENNKKLISFYLETGKIYISENINKDAKITIQTQNAFIYATGTAYSVEYRIPETIIKTFEGTVHIEKIPTGEIYDIGAGEDIIIKENEILSTNESELTSDGQEWKVETRYFNPNIKEPTIGFDTFDIYIIATTRHSIVCFSADGNLWEHVVKETIISPPTIYNRKVHIPAKKSILCFDLYSGMREPDIETNEVMEFGHRIIQYNNDLYFVFPSGIYLFNNQAIQSKPFIIVIEGTMPIFHNNQIYVTSYLTNNVEAYDLTGSLLWSIPLNDRSVCSPVLKGEFLYVGTKKNTLYKITLHGAIENQKQIEGTIKTIIAGSQFIYINTSRNRLFKFNKETLYREEFYDNINTVFIHNNILFMGKVDSVVEIVTDNFSKEIRLSQSFVTAFVYHDAVYAGLNNGYILRLKNE